MNDDTSERLKKIKSGIFSHNDVIKIDAIFSKRGNKIANDPADLSIEVIESVFIEEVESTIQTGMMWKFNPTCLRLFINDNKFHYDKNILIKDIMENSNMEWEEIDRNTNYYHLYYPLEFLLINAVQLDEQIILNADSVSIQSFVGNVEL